MGKIDTSEWKEFKLGYIMVGNKKKGHGLFEIVNSLLIIAKMLPRRIRMMESIILLGASSIMD